LTSSDETLNEQVSAEAEVWYVMQLVDDRKLTVHDHNPSNHAATSVPALIVMGALFTRTYVFQPVFFNHFISV
jgi:hypothetical protein